MILYLTIIAISLISIILCNTAFASISITTSSLYSVLSVITVIGIDAIIATIIHAIPEKCIHPLKKIYLINKKERKFYEKLGIRRWKDKIPESGKYLCHFAKDKVEQPNNNVYILKFLRETCYAGIMHVLSIPLGFIAILFLPYKLTIVLPVAIVNAFLQLLPVFVQRYNRIRLINLYNYNIKKGKDNENSKKICSPSY